MSGSATLSVNLNTNDIEDVSNFPTGSFVVTNTGIRNIEYIEIDVSDSLFPDSVFDPFGVAGDTVAKIFTPQVSSATEVGMVTPPGGFGPSAIGTTYIGPGGVNGFSKIRVEFTDFNPGEVFRFGVDMDPSSVAGSAKNSLEAAAPVLNAGSDDEWHVGAISGAELIGSTFTAGFAGGSTASGQLMGQGNDFVSSSVAVADMSSRQVEVDLRVNGLGAGAAGAYADGGPTVTIQGRAGDTARIALAKGIRTPFTNPFTGAYGVQFQAQMDELAASDFPANNAVEMQYVDVLLDGTVQDVTSQFDFTGVTENFIFPFPENELPLAFSASAITPSTGLPTGPVTSPIHMIFDASAGLPEVNVLDFDPAKDFLSFHHDFAPDPDDFQAAAANYTLAKEFNVQNYTFVSGAYGDNYDQVRDALPQFNQEFFVDGGIDYIDADADYKANGNFAQSGIELGQKWLSTLQGGGNVYVAEGGQSDITLEAVKHIQSQGFDPSRVSIVQHSGWNIGNTGEGVIDELQNLGVNWLRIDDGNRVNNTPDWKESEGNSFFRDAALTSSYAREWTIAFKFFPNQRLLDFSDAVETYHILGLPLAEAPDIATFADAFLSPAQATMNEVNVFNLSPTQTTMNEVNVINLSPEVVAEGGFAQVSILSTETVPADEIILINYTITPTGGATSGVDFGPFPGSGDVLNPDGSYSGTQDIAGSSSILSIPLEVFDDAGYDPGEGFTVTLDSVSSNAVLGNTTTATFEIADDDGAFIGPVADFALDFWGVNAETITPAATSGAGPVTTSVTQLDGPTDAFTIDEFTPGDFTFNAGPNGTRPGTYNFEATASDGISLDATTSFQVHQQQIQDLWNNGSIEGEDSNFGNGFGITESNLAAEGNDLTYRKDGLDVSTDGTGRRFVSNTEAGESVSYTAWTPDGEHTLQAVMSANGSGPSSFDLYVDDVFQDTGTVAGTAFQTVNLDVDLNGYYETLEFRFTNGGANLDSFKLVDRIPKVGDVLTAINAGGGAVTQNGINYEADTSFTRGKTYTDGAAAGDSTGSAAAFDGTIYETERFAGGGVGTSFEYNIDVEDGFYDVELNFAEIFQDGAGERLFNVEVEGQQVLTNFDILAENAGDTNATLTKVIKGVYSGLDGDATQLNIKFSNGTADRAKLSGLVVRQGEEAAPEVVRAINTGGSALEQDGINFEADTLFIGGGSYTDGANPKDPAGNQAALDGTVGETERFGSSFSYAIDVAEAGEYDVDLLFSEIYFDQSGARLFNVDIEGTRALTNYDILTEGGGNVNSQLKENFNGINSADYGSATAIEIDFQGVSQNAKISGIVITQDSPLEAITATPEGDPLLGMSIDPLQLADPNML